MGNRQEQAMKNKGYFTSLIFGMLGALLMVPLVGDVNAAPSDVRGSGNIAVDSYKNSQGTFILYSDGRITNYDKGENVAPPYTDEVPDYVKAGLERGLPTGSPNVAVGLVPHKSGTYVLFADGSIKNPVNANKGSSDNKILRGIIDTSVPRTTGSTKIVGANEGWTMQRPTNAAGQPGVNNVRFDEPYDEVPVVILTAVGGNNYFDDDGALSPQAGNSGVIVESVNEYGFKYRVNQPDTWFHGNGQSGNTPVFHFAVFPNE
jgi:hypothetical protein